MPLSLFSPWPARSFIHRHPEHLACLTRSFCATGSRWKEPAEPKPKSNLAAVDIEGPDVKPTGLPPLNRPLGVRERPTTLIKSRTERMKDLMDKDIRMAQRRHLIKEASKGYFHDMNMTRKHGGKTWIAPKVLIREDKALYLPNITGTSLSGEEKKNTTEMCYGRITILAMLGTKISEIHTQGFAGSTNARFSSNPLYQFVQINLQENILKSFLLSFFINSLRNTVPKPLHSTYLVSRQNLEYVRDPLGMTNSKVGYVYLIDENLKIRWGGCADASAEEAQALENCTAVLLKRLEQNPKKDLRPVNAPKKEQTPETEAPKTEVS